MVFETAPIDRSGHLSTHGSGRPMGRPAARRYRRGGTLSQPSPRFTAPAAREAPRHGGAGGEDALRADPIALTLDAARPTSPASRGRGLRPCYGG